jgi:hypothetical protein
MRKLRIKHILLLFALLGCSTLRAQGVDDAILNSQMYYEGTGRSMAMGNATGALGGDITAMCINPAGLGLYRSQEFTFTTGLQHTIINSNYYDSSQNAGRFRVTIPSLGLILSSPFSNYEAIRYVQFGIGFTRTNDFNFKSSAFGLNPSTSMVDAFLQTINGINTLFNPSTNVGNYLYDNYPYNLSPAWETYLIDQYTDSLGKIFYDSPVPPGNINQSDKITSKGRNEEWTFAVASNLYDKLFVGACLGVKHLKRISKREYSETPANEQNPGNLFDKWDYIESLGDTAWGVNFKCGVIYYPTDWLRIGAAWHSRTRYTFGENWSTAISTTLKSCPDGETYHRYLSPVLYQAYEFSTPHTFIGSLAFIIGQHGLVSADVEYLNYGSSKFTSYEFSFDDTNNDIKNILKPSFNIRLGTEWRVRQFFLRCGAAYYGSPYGFGEDYGSVKKVALGVGYATGAVTSWDFAYELSESTTAYTPYGYYVDGQNIVNDLVQHKWRNKVVATLKFKL